MASLISRVWVVPAFRGLSRPAVSYVRPVTDRRLSSHELHPPALSGNIEWTQHEDKLLIDLRVRGTPVQEIASQLPGRTIKAAEIRWLTIAPRSQDGRLMHYSGPKPFYTAFEDDILESFVQSKPKRKSLLAIFKEVQKRLPTRSIDSLSRRYHHKLHPRNKTWQQTRSRRLYTRSEVSRVIELREVWGLSLNDIAAQLGRSAESVKHAYARAVKGGKSTSRGDQVAADDAKIIQLRKAGNGPAKIASEFTNRSKESIKTLLEELGRRHDLPVVVQRWTTEEDSKLLSLRKDGKTAEEITFVFPERSVASIYHRTRVLREGSGIRPTRNDGIAVIAELRERLLKLRDNRVSWAAILLEFPERSKGFLKEHLTAARKARATTESTGSSREALTK